MAFDYGRRRIGVAVSDESGRLARPLATVSAVPRRRAMESIKRLIAEQEPQVIVVGDPRGGTGRASLDAEVRLFASRLRESARVEVVLRDETLTSFEAAERLREAGAGAARRRAKIDGAAAALILQDYLESLGGGKG